MKTNNFILPAKHYYSADLNYYNEQGNYITIGKLFFIPAHRVLLFEPNYDENILRDFDSNYNSEFFHMVIKTLASDLTSKNLRKYAHRNSSLMMQYVSQHTEYLANEFRFSALQKH